MRHPSCLRQVLNGLLIIASLALVAMAATYAAAAKQCLELKPSGNKLYDRFAAAVRARQGLSLYGGCSEGGPLLAAGTVQAWEAQFKDEPQYWQLRYWLGMAEYASQQAAAASELQPQTLDENQPAQQAANQPAKATPAKEQAEGASANAASSAPQPQRVAVKQPDLLPHTLLDPLLQAVKNGSADEKVYLLLYEAQLAAMDPDATVEQRQPMLALLNKAIDFGSGRSWGYYLRALHHLDVLKGESVDWPAVRADLDSGNQAQLNARPLAFPHSYVEEQLAGRARAAGSQVLAGAVLAHGAQVEALTPLSRTLARTTRICIAHCIEANDQGLAGAMMRCLCRMAAAEDALPQEKLEAAGLLRVIAYYLGTRIDSPVTWQQREDVFEAIRWMDDASCMGRVALDQLEQTRMSHLAFYLWLSSASPKITGKRGWPLPAAPPLTPRYIQYKIAFEMRYTGRELTFERFDRLLARLSRFDLTTLSLPYDLSPVNQPKRLPRRSTPPAGSGLGQPASGKATTPSG